MGKRTFPLNECFNMLWHIAKMIRFTNFIEMRQTNNEMYFNELYFIYSEMHFIYFRALSEWRDVIKMILFIFIVIVQSAFLMCSLLHFFL